MQMRWRLAEPGRAGWQPCYAYCPRPSSGPLPPCRRWNVKWPLMGTMVVSILVVLYETARDKWGWDVPEMDKVDDM